MKASLATLTVSLLLAAAYTQSCAGVADKFLASLHYHYPSGNVTTATPVIAPPNAPFDVCGEIWRVSGTCCNVSAMKAVYADLMTGINFGWSFFINGVNNVKFMLKRLRSMSANSETVKADLTAAHNTTKTPYFEGLDRKSVV